MGHYTVIRADDVDDVYAGTSVPGEVGAGSVARVAPRTPGSHRNEGDEPVEMWVVSQRLDSPDAVKIDDFWEASPDAVQERPAGS